MHGVPAQKSYLFVDLRHVLCSDLQYVGLDGRPLPLYPKGEPVPVSTSTFMMPHGIRLAAEPVTEIEPVPPAGVPTNRILFDGGMYRAWGMKPVNEGGRAFYDICVSESSDAFTWKPVHTCRIASPGGLETDELAVFIDPHAPPSERYKGVFCIVPPQDQWAAMFEEYCRVHRHHRIWRLSPDMVLAVY